MSTATPPKPTVDAVVKVEDAKPTRSDRYYDESGDIELLSSDNVLFKLHAYNLQASSTVFRDMLKYGSANRGGPIEMIDNDLETSGVMANLFDIMLKGANILDVANADGKQRSSRKLVVLFAQMYDFTHELRIIKYQLQTAIYRFDVGNRSPISVFNLGFMLDERKICADAIRKSGGGWNWSDGVQLGEEKIFGERLKGANVFDLSGYSLADLRLLPVEIIWALVRVCHRTSTLTAVEFKAESEAKAVAYTRLMALPGAPEFA